MSTPIESDDLHVGRDPNDTTWLVVRYPNDWAPAVAPPNGENVYFDPLASVVELAPAPPDTSNDGPLCGPPPLPPQHQPLPPIPVPAVSMKGTAVISDRIPLPLPVKVGVVEGGSDVPHPLPRPTTQADISKIWLPLAPVTDENGDQYVSSPLHDQVLRKRACDEGFTPLPCFGGSGWETGRLSMPIGLAIDGRGFLFVADACNHRVQVVRPADGSVVLVMGRVDSYGRPVSGNDCGAMTEPVDVAVDRCHCRVFVADRLAGLIHVFNQRFEWVRSFAALPAGGAQSFPPGENPMPVGLAVTPEGNLLVADAHWPRLILVTPDGKTLAELPLRPDTDPHFAGLVLQQEFELEGTAIVGPLDSRGFDTQWHQVVVEADVPPGTQVAVQTFASASSTAPAVIPWSPADPVPITSDEPADEDSYRRLIISDVARWERWVALPQFLGQPSVAQFAKDVNPGPAKNATTVTVPVASVSQLRVGDSLVFTTGPVVNTVQLNSVPSPMVTFTASGASALYSAGAVLTLDDRDGGLRAPQKLYTLDGTEVIDLSGITADGATLYTRTILQNAAGYFRAGDLIEISDAFSTTRLAVQSVVYPSTSVGFAPPLGADFANSLVTLDVPATDRGQYIWVRVILRGAKAHPADQFAVATPAVRALRILYQRPTLLAFLPNTFSRRDELRDPAGAVFLERYLTLFEGTYTRVESRYESFSRILNPSASPPEWLTWLGSWLDLVFDPSWPIERRRELVLRAMDLYKRRGTPGSIKDWVEIYTGKRPELIEGFQTRGAAGMVIGQGATLGCGLLLDECCAASTTCDPTAVADAYAHRFTLYVYLDDACEQKLAGPAVRAIVEAMKPAHTLFDLQLVLPEARVGVQSTVGIDLVLGDDAPPPRTVLGLGIPPTTGGRFRPIVGLDLFLEPDPRHRAAAPSAMGTDGVRIDAQNPWLK